MRARSLMLFVSVSATALVGAAPGWAQQSLRATAPAPAGSSTPNTQSNDSATPEAPVGQDIVVTGFRSAETKEILEKRSAIEITDGISSDDLGRIPDMNIGEAMQRIPGIQINREGEGREATVNLRGLPGEYARTTMNGVSFAEPILQGSTPFGAYLSDVFSGVRVEKSQLAHSIAGGLSGNIDLQIAPALSRKDGFRMKAALDYNELDERKEPSFTLGVNKHITDTFAVFGTIAYKRENFRRDSVFLNAYGTLTGTNNTTSSTGTPDFLNRYKDYYAPAGTCTTTYASTAGCVAVAGGTGAKAVTGVQYASQARQYMRSTKGEQYSSSGGMEWKPDDHWTLGLVGLYTNRNQKDTTQTFQTLNLSGIGTTVNPTSDVRQGPNGTYFVDSFTFSNPNNITDNRILPVVQRAWGLDGTIDFADDDWKLKTTGTYSKARNSAREMYISLSRTPQAGVTNGITGSLSTGLGNWDNYALITNGDTVPTLVPKVAWTQPANQTASNASNYYDSPAGTPGRTTFRITGTQSEAASKLMALQQDFERQLHGGPFSSIQAGLRWERTEFRSSGSKVSGYGINPAGIDPNLLIDNPDAGNFFQGSLSGASSYWKVVDVDAMFASVGPARVANGTTLNEFGLNNEYDDDNNVGRYNFSNTTNVMSAYGEAKIDTQILSMPFKGSLGMRYESTTRELNVLNRLAPYNPAVYPVGSLSEFTSRNLKDDYGYWLPSGILILEPAKNLLARFAAYKTYVRPHPRQFSPITLIGQVDVQNNIVAVTLGNPDLKPYTGTSYDISLEWYNRPGGVVAVNIFQKTFKGLIQSVRGAALCPADGGGLGFGSLQTQGDLCIAPQSGGLTVNVTGNINSDTPIRVRGVEANIKQNFNFLPGVLRHLGGGANYSYTEIGGTLPSGEAATLAGVSKHNVNLIGYYETGLFGLRMTYNYRSAYDVPDQVIFGFGGASRRVAPRGQLDGSFTLNVNDSVSLNLSAFNITNAVRKEYQGIEALARRIDYDGRTFRVALNASF